MKYIVEADAAFEVMVVVPPQNTLREPTDVERDALDTYFASPAARDAESGMLIQLLGDDCDGVDGYVMMYPITSPDTRLRDSTAG